jgi:hypothetical protein
MTRIIIIGTYFGKWPTWFPAFLLSCAKNLTIDWLFLTDCEIPQVTYPNITFKQMNLQQFNDLASKQIGFRIQKDVYSQVDLQPAYGEIFKENIKGYDFWGHCDIDLVWGDIRRFITEEILMNFDIVSCRKDFLAGHLTLWRNKSEVNTLFRSVPAYQDIFSSREHHGFDESIISIFLKRLIASGRKEIRIYWPEQMVAGFFGESTPNGWYWENGKAFDAKKHEQVYIHFQHWKKNVNCINFQVGEEPMRFEFTETGIRSRQYSINDHISKLFRWKGLKRSASQFFSFLLNYLRFFKKVLFVNDIFWARQLMANSISARDVRYSRKTGFLFLKRPGFYLKKQEYHFLGSYYSALQLVDQLGAKYQRDEHGQLLIEVAGFRAYLNAADEILLLRKLLVDGIYNRLFDRPTVIIDIGMDSGLTSIFFACQHNVIVYGYEPCEKQFGQTLRNIALNPGISEKIFPYKAVIGDSKFSTIAMYLPVGTNQFEPVSPRKSKRGVQKFDFEEIEIEDVSNVIEMIVARFPDHDVVLKIDFEHSEYHIDGVSENHLINRLHDTGKLYLIETIMLEWHKPKADHVPPRIASQLSDYGFKTILLTPHDIHEGMLYAMRGNSSKDLVYSELRSPIL